MHFKQSEFICPCCGKNKINQLLIDKLELLREKANAPIIITSGYRCEKHNQEVGGAAASYHVKGMAADIKCRGISPEQLASMAEEIGFGGIGIYPTWIHVDIRIGKARWRK